MRITLDIEAQQIYSLANLEKTHGGSPLLEIDPETGQGMGEYVGRLESIRAHAQTLRRRR